MASNRPVSADDILVKACYDLSTHPAESMDWLNVLFAQVRRSHLDRRESSPD